MDCIVDTHAHIYHGDEQAYPMKENPYRPAPGIGTVEHLQREREENGVARAVLVQTGSAYRWDNRLLGDTAAACREWAVGVCTLDPTAVESAAEFERLVGDYHVKGLRMEVSPQGFRHAGSERLWGAARRLGGVICAHLHRDHLGELAGLLEAFPEVPVVLDHCAYPKLGDGGDDGTVEEVCELARFSQLHAKLTFGVTASREDYPFCDTQPLLRRIIAAYGPERCMWGSDFPCEHWLKKTTYGQHLALFTEELELSRGEQEAILSGAPMRVWFGE